MSVGLVVLDGGGDFDDIEVMAPDYDREYLWLWRAEDGENRIDLSRDQLRQLRNLLDEVLPIRDCPKCQREIALKGKRCPYCLMDYASMLDGK